MTDWVADSFAGDPKLLAAVAVPPGEPWESITTLNAQLRPGLLLGVFPSHLQIDLRYYRAVRGLGMSSLSVAQEQMQAGLALIQPLLIGGIVTTRSALPGLLDALPSFAQGAAPYLQVVLAPEERPMAVAGYRTFFELHMTPGLPLLYQCPHLATGFHATKRFSSETFTQAHAVSERSCPCGNRTLITLT